jgi:hypothetical protein
MSCPSALITWGATAHSSAAIAPSVSKTHKNHADPGPTVNMCRQKWKKLKSAIPGG